MHLTTYLQRAGVTSGPSFKNTSHSQLEVIKRGLLGLPQFKGGEAFLSFGSALHEQWLEAKKGHKLDKVSQLQLHSCLQALNSSQSAMWLLKDSVREEKLKTRIHGVEMAFILDIHKKKERIGADLKTTGVRNLSEFVLKAKEYGYFRQAITYIRAANLKDFYFIAVTKTASPKVFIMRVGDYPEELHYAEEELKFLLYFYGHYGKIQTEN